MKPLCKAERKIRPFKNKNSAKVISIGLLYNKPVTSQKIALVLILAVFTCLQLRAISGGNYAGQDYQRHLANIRESAKHPWAALRNPMAHGRSPATLYHWIAGRIFFLA